ncbi:TPR repeat-containing protein DDB_G0287407-like [Littorina saxatilis]|uniref:TPR repeat-containing protein DDB_G0287407-like n=1 Tax=Littorina saxatilis TaxID=31220 RepID=UPI0038B5627B
MTSLTTNLKDPRTCRVFVSSPFGGIEREREELVALYFPQLAALCQAKGVQFVTVDMRWGITEEAARDNQVVNICLREIDRSDIFIGIYGQRYGWHGSKDEELQRNVDLSIKRYPWLKSVRDRSVTEFEFMHGHLNKPGAVPAAFAFRAKAYDKTMAQTADDQVKRKYEVESAQAKKLLDDLKERVKKTKTKCFAIHDNYNTPEEAAKFLFEGMKTFMENVLLKDSKAQSPRDLELACHDAYMANRTSLFIGGDAYMKELNQTLQKGGVGHLVVGPAGSGKGAVVSNWVAAVKKKKSHELIYHFVGCSKDSTSVSGILSRLIEELETLAGVVKKRKGLEEREEEDAKPSNLSEMFQQLQVVMDKAAKRKKILIVIDGVSRIEQQSRTSKPLFWLPTTLPPKAVTVVMTCREDHSDVIQELTKRGFSITKMKPLTEQQQKEFCVGILQQNSKELSPAQLKKIVEVKQAENPLYLKIVISELCSFGNFRLLDSKISSLMEATNVAGLFEQFLVRLEEDYNGQKETIKTLIPKVMCGLTLTKKGLTETEIREMLDVPSAAWSPVYFSIKDFILDHSGLLTLAFQELREAVHRRYMSTKKEKDQYLRIMIAYFQKQRKLFAASVNLENAAVGRVAQELPWLLQMLGDRDLLIDTLVDMVVFGRMFMDEEYELMEMWRSTGISGEQIAQLYLTSIEERRQRFVKEATKSTVNQVIELFVLSYLDALTYFLELNHFTQAAEGVLRQRLAVLESVSGKIPEDRRQSMLSMVKVKLSYIYAETGNFDQAQKLLTDVLKFRIDLVEKSKGEEALLALKDLAGCYHAIGLLHSKTGDLDNAVEHYKKSMEIHGKLERPVEFADSMNNLGVMLMKKGDFDQAAQLCLKALKIYEAEYFGHLPPIIGVLTGNIAVCYRNLNRFEESELMYKKAVDIAERALGRNHPNVAVALTNLGTLEVNRNMHEEADKYFSESLAIHKACSSGPTNNDFFKTREKYVYTLIKLNKVKEAMAAFTDLHDQTRKANLWSRAWPVVWLEVMSLMLTNGQAAKAAAVAETLLKEGPSNDVVYTFLDKADRAMKRKEKRPAEMTVAYALEKNPASQLLLTYQAQEVLIPDGKTAELLALLDQSEAALKAGSNLYHAAVTWCQDKGKKQMADAVIEHAANKFPDDVNLASQMASRLRDEEKFNEAIPYVHRLLKAKSGEANVLLFCGEILMRSGNLPKAKEIFTKVTHLCKPDSGEHKQAKSALSMVDMMAQQKKK